MGRDRDARETDSSGAIDTRRRQTFIPHGNTAAPMARHFRDDAIPVSLIRPTRCDPSGSPGRGRLPLEGLAPTDAVTCRSVAAHGLTTHAPTTTVHRQLSLCCLTSVFALGENVPMITPATHQGNPARRDERPAQPARRACSSISMSSGRAAAQLREPVPSGCSRLRRVACSA